ncbi:phosphoribosylanthranilate isomerase [Occallatibacter savannae]|uniref:phosphoribosylanthranilate isomerase n=1 Tax=Occallatibacter savannae TaxID=1002691 RepID=UPI000D69F2D0|nr:phosphoribosylanthranilate isomerase [Occallatibacter savannae]
MSLWVKVCANTSMEDAMLAVNAGADAVGFVFAPSPRQVSVEQVAAITPNLPSSIEKIGVFAGSTPQEIARAVERCGLTGAQLHFEGGQDLVAALRDRFGTTLRILNVLHYAPDASEKAAFLAANKQIDAILVDSRTPAAIGGTGIRFDWDDAASLFNNAGVKMIAAGGLNPANVAEAIEKLQPWGVDVASGVEAAPGRKDPEKVRSFVENARRARS